MRSATDLKIVIVSRATRLQGLRKRFGTISQAKFVMRSAARREALKTPQEAQSVDLLADYQAEDDTYQHAIDALQDDLSEFAPVLLLDRERLPTYLFGKRDVVVTVGQDGLVANTAKYALDLPIIGSNPDPARFDGVLLPFKVEQVKAQVAKVLAGQARMRAVTLAQVQLSDQQKLLAFNDFFIGARSHVSARYTIRSAGRVEAQSSSGVIVSTGAGSTGWLSSVFNMTAGVAAALARGPLPQAPPPRLTWEDKRLCFVVREPFVSRTSAANLVFGLVNEGAELTIESAMPSGGVVFSDGVESDFLEFPSGTLAHIRAAPQQALLVVP